MRFNSGKVKEDNKRDKYFRIKGQYLDFNSKIFNKAIIIATIQIFQGLKLIYSLKYFPFKYHPNIKEEKQKLINRSYKFILLIKTHHQQYKNKAFYIEKENPIKVSIDGQIIVNLVLF